MMLNKMKKGVTLIELLIALAITAVIGVGAAYIQKNSTKMAAAGVANLKMTKTAEKTLSEIYNDLKLACVPYKDDLTICFGDIVQTNFSKKQGLENAEFVFFKMYPTPVFEFLSERKKAYRLRPLVHIKYFLKPSENSDLLTLVKEVCMPGSSQPEETVLAKNVSFFNITPVSIKTDTCEKWMWNVELRLAQNFDSKGGLSHRGKRSLGFYKTVYPLFYNSVAEGKDSIRAWNTGFIFSRN